MRWSAVARSRRDWLFSPVAGLLLGCVMASVPLPVYAVTSEVGATVCGSGAPAATITISEPNDDSVVDQPSVTFRGTIVDATQIDITLDGQYVTTLAIGANQTTFETDIVLTQGTHTVTFTANAVCGAPNGTDSVVMTYQPAVDPSTGESTPTEVEGQGGVVIGPDATIAPDEVPQGIGQLPVIGAAVSVVAEFANVVGLSGTIAAGNPVAGVARVGLTVAALTTVVMASSLAPVAAQAIPGLSEAFNVSSQRSMLYLGWLIRGAGVLTMAMVYFV